MLSVNDNKWQEVLDIELLSQFAIEAALSSSWQQAVAINEKIIKLDDENIEALNRLGRAYLLKGDCTKANKTYQKVISLDPYNTIAQKNLDKIAKMDTKSLNGNSSTNGSLVNLASVFCFEPGKTKVINLLNLAPPAVLANLNCGEKAQFLLKKHSVAITKDDGTYLGALPDDLSFKIIKLTAGGNKYEVYVKYATTKSLTVFIREIQRAARYSNQPSFAQGADEKMSSFA